MFEESDKCGGRGDPKFPVGGVYQYKNFVKKTPLPKFANNKLLKTIDKKKKIKELIKEEERTRRKNILEKKEVGMTCFNTAPGTTRGFFLVVYFRDKFKC